MIQFHSTNEQSPPVNLRDREKAGGGGSWKGAAGLAADVRYYGEWMRDRAWERIGHLYPTLNGETVIAWLWARTVRCPNPACGAQMPLVSSFWLSKKPGNQVWVEPQIDRKNRTVSFTVKRGRGRPPEPPKVSRGPSSVAWYAARWRQTSISKTKALPVGCVRS